MTFGYFTLTVEQSFLDVQSRVDNLGITKAIYHILRIVGIAVGKKGSK